MANEPGHAVRLHGGKRWIEAARGKRSYLVERARGQHCIETHIDPAIKLLTLDLQKDLDGTRCVDSGLHAVAVPVAERATSREHDLERAGDRSEEHTSELQSLRHLVCRLLLEKQ